MAVDSAAPPGAGVVPRQRRPRGASGAGGPVAETIDAAANSTPESGGPRRRRPLYRRLVAPVVEILVLLGLAVIYNVVRAGGGDAVEDAAMAHARRIVELEGWVFEHVELALDQWIVGVPVIAVAACYFYALMHYVMTPLVLLVSRRHGGWHYWRGYLALVLACALALISYANFPVAPPRLVPDLGSVDVMRAFADWGWWGDAASAPRGLGDATNQYAAMPSLHFGWSLWCGIQMWGFRHPAWRVGAVAYPTLQLLVVVATANHFLLDVFGGALCVLAAFGLAAAGRRLAGPLLTGRRSMAGLAAG